jgi:uncharacterized membrane protein HdeD (DUF308 family)
MNNKFDFGMVPRFTEVETVRKNWGWFLALGVLNMAVGLVAMSYAFLTTIFSVFILGAFLGVSGIFQVVHAFWAHKWSGLFMSLLLGIVYLVTAGLCLLRPLESAASLTLLIGMFCFVIGLFRIGTALIQRYERWGWILVNGIVTLLFGILIMAEWPISGLWLIGVIIGVDMFFVGISWAILAIEASRKE